MPKARTVEDVILGEAVSGSPAKRYADMKAIASVIANRARALGVSPEEVVSVRREFNAYGKRLPAGVTAYRDLARQAINEVAQNGPVHGATFYATPSASRNLPKGLKRETSTTGHVYYSDPQNRAIGTSLGYRQPRPQETAAQAIAGIMSPEAQPATVNQRMGLMNSYSPQAEAPQMASTVPTRSVQTTSYLRPEPQVSLDVFRQPQAAQKMSLADQYASYGAGKATAAQAGLLGQDVAYQRMIDGLNAQKKQLEMGINPMDTAEPWKQQPGLVGQTAPQPMADVPQVSTEQTVSVSGPAGAGGLLSPQEQQMFEAQRANLMSQPLNSKVGMNLGNFAKGAFGGLGGGLLGAALLGPVGGLLGAALGKSAMTGTINRQITGFPEAPKSKSQGDGKETEYGRSVRESSKQYDRAVKSGSVGLW